MHALAKTSLVALLALTATPAASAQRSKFKTPWESPAATIALDVGITTLTVNYHRPALKGRNPWLQLGDTKNTQGVWRLGANEATTFECSDPITLGGAKLAAGKYSLFAIVGEEKWTLIVNKAAQQWGSYFYDPKQDVVRFDVACKKVAAEQRREWFTLALDPTDADSAEMVIAWDDRRLVVPIDVDVDGQMAAQVERVLKELDPKDTDTRLAIAKYWCQRDEELEEARHLLDEILAQQSNIWAFEWKGRVVKKLGEDALAAELLQKAYDLSANGGFPEDYRNGLKRQLAEWATPAKPPANKK